MEQATTGKAPPPIAINSGGGIQILNMNAVRAAAVGATVVPSPGSAQTVVGSPGPPVKPVGPRMLHITPQMLAANSRPGAPAGEESDEESVRSCDDTDDTTPTVKLKTVNNILVPAAPASNTGASSDLLPCDNNTDTVLHNDYDEDECEEGEIRDSDDEEDCIRPVNHSTSEDDHDHRGTRKYETETTSDNHGFNEIKNDLTRESSTSQVTGNKCITSSDGSSLSLKERSDSPCKSLPPSSPPPEPDPDHSSNDSSDLGRPASDNQEIPVLNESNESRIRDVDLKMEFISHSSPSKLKGGNILYEGAQPQQVDLDRDDDKLIDDKCSMDLDFDDEEDDNGAMDEIERGRNGEEEDRRNNNSGSVSPSDFYVYKTDVPGSSESANIDCEEEPEEDQGANKSLNSSPNAISPNDQSQQCVQQDYSKTSDSDIDDNRNNSFTTSPSDTMEAVRNRETSDSVVVVPVQSGLIDVTTYSRDNCSDLGSCSPHRKSTSPDPVPKVSVPEEETPPPLIHRMENSGMQRGDSSSSMDPSEAMDDVNLDFLPCETSREIVAEKAKTPPVFEDAGGGNTNGDGETGGISEQEKRKDDQDKEKVVAQVEENEDDENTRPKLMDMTLADYIFMDVDEDNGHKPWNSISNTIKSTSRSPTRNDQQQQQQHLQYSSSNAGANTPPFPQPTTNNNPTSLELLSPVRSYMGLNPSPSKVALAPDSSAITPVTTSQAPQNNASCAFQMYTIGQDHNRRQFSHTQPQPPQYNLHQSNDTFSTSTAQPQPQSQTPKIAARIPPRPEILLQHQLLTQHFSAKQQHSSYPNANIGSRLQSVFNNFAGDGSSNRTTNIILNSDPNNRFPSSIEPSSASEYKSNQQTSSGHRFTTDPQLYSQYVQYTKHFPVGQSQSSHESTVKPSPPSSVLNHVHTHTQQSSRGHVNPEAQHNHNLNQTKSFSPTTTARLVIQQQQHQFQQQSISAAGSTTGGHSNQQLLYQQQKQQQIHPVNSYQNPSQARYHQQHNSNNLSGTGYQQGSGGYNQNQGSAASVTTVTMQSQSQQYLQGGGSTNPNGPSITGVNKFQTGSGPAQQVIRMSDYLSVRFPAMAGNNLVAAAVSNRSGQVGSVNASQGQGSQFYQSVPPNQAQSLVQQPQRHQFPPQQQQQSPQLQKTYSSCSYENTSGPAGGIATGGTGVGSRNSSSSLYGSVPSQMYQQKQQQNYTSPGVARHSENFNFHQNKRPSMSPSGSAYGTPVTGATSMPSPGTPWNSVPTNISPRSTRTAVPDKSHQQQPFVYPNQSQNLGRALQPQQADKIPYENIPSASSSHSFPTSQDHQRRSVIAQPARYSSPVMGGNANTGTPSSYPTQSVAMPYGNSATSPGSTPIQQRLQLQVHPHQQSQSGSSTSMTSPQMLRNPQQQIAHAHHYKSNSYGGDPPTGNSALRQVPSPGNHNQSVIRPNIYSTGGVISTVGNSNANVKTNANYGGGSQQTFSDNSSNSNVSVSSSYYHNNTNRTLQASVICAPQSQSSMSTSSGYNSNSCREQQHNQTGSSYVSGRVGVVEKDFRGSSSSLSSGGSGYSGELTLQAFLSHPSAPFLCPPSSQSPVQGSSQSERSGSGYYGNERVWERPYTARGGDGDDEEQYPLSSCQYSDAMRRYNAPITLQALSGLPPGANHLLVKTENGQLQLVSVRMQSPTAAPGTPIVPSTVAAPPTSLSIAQQLPSNSPLPPLSSGSPLVPPSISSTIISTTTIPPHQSHQGRIITSSSSNHIGTSWSTNNNNSLVNNNSTSSSPLPIITSTAAHPPPHLVPPLVQSSPHSHPSQPNVPSSVIMPPNLSASNSQLLISTANNISSSPSSSSSIYSTAAQAAVAAAQAAYNQQRAPHPVVVSNVPPQSGGGSNGPPPSLHQPPPPPVGAHQPSPHPSVLNSIPPGASVIRTGVIANSLPPPPPIVVSTSSTSNSPAVNSAVTSSVVVTSTPNNSNLNSPLNRPLANTSQVPNNNAGQNSGMRMMLVASTASNSKAMHPPQLHHIHPAYLQMHHSPLLPPPQHQVPVSPGYSSNNPIAYASSNTTANTVSQMSNETAKNKCKNFLSFLLELSAKQNQTVARNVKNLIQGLIDGKVNEENFADRLQKEVNSQPQPCLVGFLKKSLPHLRHSLATGELKIEGIKPPPLSTLVPPPPVSALVPQTPSTPTESRKKPSKQTTPVRPTTPTVPAPTPVRILTPPVNSASSSIPPAPVSVSSGGTGPSAHPPTTTSSPSSAKSSKPSKGGSSKSKSSAGNSNASVGGVNTSSSGPGGTPSAKSSIPSMSKSGKEKEKKDKTFSSSGYSADDDINDVAAMGGVNLAEESQRILGSTEYVGTQIRSCRDETLIQASPIIAKFKVIAAKFGLDESPSQDVSALLSHAVEERLKTMIEKLSVIAEHRMDVIKLDDRYEITQDVKGQLRFLEELDKIEKKRHDEQEREMLIRAAKSRSKSEDPEQAKLKAKAKEMQRVALEEMRQRDANLTALQAIGPRKKPKLDLAGGSHGSVVPSPLGATGASSSLGRPQMALRPRLKRVNLRDLLFLLEHDKETMRSPFLYKNLLLK